VSQMTTAPALDEQDLAAQYGWSMAVLNSDPDLKNLFSKAVAGTWDANKFAAELRNTNWYKNNGEAARQAAILRNADPATWRERVAQQFASITTLGAEMGAVLNDGIVNRIAESALMFGWNQDNIRNALGEYVTSAGGQYHGQAQTYENELRQYASDMGVRVGDDTFGSWINNITRGRSSLDGVKGAIQNMAEGAFPQLAERFKNGETYSTIASAYKQSMASVLEINPAEIDNFDPTVRKALSWTDKEGKPAAKSLWQFENDLRQDSRWNGTQNAQDSLLAAGRQVLTDFGLIS